jgi:hypothetical protein
VRTIKLFAVIGLAVALVAVPALTQGQQPTTINVKCSAATPSKPEVDNRSVTLKQGSQVQWVFNANLNTCVDKDLASAKITLTYPCRTNITSSRQASRSGNFNIHKLDIHTSGNKRTAGPYPV